MIKTYPVIFTELKGICFVEVPDMGILTEGKNLEDAIYMARDAIGIKGISLEDSGQVLPNASKVESINPKDGTFSEAGDGIVSLVEVDFEAYRKKLVRKWLEEM